MGYAKEILPGLWRFTAIHPEWKAGDDWEPVVAWWAVQTDRGLLLIDPLVDDWQELDGLIVHAGGCAGIARTCAWHQRSLAEAADRYAASVWARPSADPEAQRPFDRAIAPGEPLPGDLLVLEAVMDTEVTIWSAPHRALMVADVLIRDADGALSLCPESWIENQGGYEAVKEGLTDLLELGVENVLVSHGPLVLGRGLEELAAVLGAWLE
jgi:hypothetical protein